MTDSSVASEPEDFSIVLAAHATADSATRERNIRRTIVAVAVLILHVMALAVLIYSSRVPIVQRIRSTVPEAILWFVLPPKPANPKLVSPVLPEEPLPQVVSPITLPPIPARPLFSEEPSEGLLGVGRSLACGASSYENLSTLQREQCRRRPWNFVRRPNGTIVLDAPKPVEQAPVTIDILRHQQQTAPPCPLLSNVPCLDKVIHGDPTGGGPQPF